MFTNVIDAIYWIEHIERLTKENNLKRMAWALEILGNPQNDYKKIHIAGTNGKGSTTAFIKNILIEAGYRVGAFVSPYIVKFNERIELNYGYISDDDLLYYCNLIYDVSLKVKKEHNEVITFFEALSLIALKYFSDKKVSYAIIEVGIGGKDDATNIINADLSIITNIGFDHMKQLGNTLEEIAFNKLGIVKKNNMLITTVDKKLVPLFQDYILKKEAKVKFIDTEKIYVYSCEHTSFVYEEKPIDLSVIGIHQAYNATLAIEAALYLLPELNMKKIKKALLNTTWPGRLEIMQLNPKVIIDGAHNIHGHEALALTMKKVYKGKIIHVVFAAMADKQTDKMIEKIEEYANDITLTDFDYYRVKDAFLLQNENNHKSFVIKPYDQAIKKVIENSKRDEIILITGSLYFASIARKLFKKE